MRLFTIGHHLPWTHQSTPGSWFHGSTPTGQSSSSLIKFDWLSVRLHQHTINLVIACLNSRPAPQTGGESTLSVPIAQKCSVCHGPKFIEQNKLFCGNIYRQEEGAVSQEQLPSFEYSMPHEVLWDVCQI